MVRITTALFGSIGLIACTQAGNVAEKTQPDTPTPATPPVQSGSPARNDDGLTPEQQTEWNAIEALEAEAKVLAKIEGCAASSACRTAPVGSRACGGPRYYIPWCSATTDSAVLYAKLEQVAQAEQSYNKKHSMASTCEMRLPPEVAAAGGSCMTR